MRNVLPQVMSAIKTGAVAHSRFVALAEIDQEIQDIEPRGGGL